MGLLDHYGANTYDPNNAGPGDSGGTTDGGYNPPPVAPPPPQLTGGITPFGAPPTTGGVGGGGGGAGSGFGNFNFGPVPVFDGPGFTPPSAEDLNTPGYQSRLAAGEQALQRSAAAKGLVRSGGTLKDLVEYGQNFASNEYNNSFNQALQAYGTRYQLAKDRYAPLLAQWDLLSKAEIQKMLAEYNRGTVWNAPRGGGGGGEQFPDPNIFGL
jgi:hypothetical protein